MRDYDVSMWKDVNTCYQALVARDARFDGQFFVGVSSTGIYCRLVCGVRVPKRENCVAMRALGWPDAFPHTDYAIMKGLGETTPRRVLEMAEPWRPWRAYAAMHLWNSLSVNEAA